MRFFKSPRGKKILVGLTTTFILGVLVFIGINTFVYSRGKSGLIESSSAKKAEAILVLGAYTYQDMVSPILRDRLLRGLELYQQGLAPKILVSGDHGRDDYDEVNAMRLFLQERGVPPEDIFMDHAGFSTYDSMIRARDIFQVKKLLVVTQEFHLVRAIYIARSLGLQAEGVTSDLSTYPALGSLQRRELLARIKAFGEVTINRSPTYGGTPHPITGDGTSTHDLRD